MKDKIHLLLLEDDPREWKIVGTTGDFCFTIAGPTPEL